MASLQEKIAFFDQLKPLYSDDEFDANEKTERNRCRKFFSARPVSKSSSREEPIVLDLTGDESQQARATPRRISSAPTIEPTGSSKVIKGTPMTATGQKNRLDTILNQHSAGAILVDDTPIPESARPVQRDLLRRSSTLLFPSRRHLEQAKDDSPSANISMRKRKREPLLKLRPESEQIFKDLTFFYVPDDDVAPARRLRITKAREFGATWVRAPRIATHIIVDKHIQFKDLEGTLKGINKNLPPKVVNEDYPIDCIQFKALLVHSQKKYQLAGQPMVQEEDKDSTTPSNSEESVQSLQIKPAHKNPKRWDYIAPGGTPDMSGESSRPSQVSETPIPTDSQPVILDLETIASSPKQASEDNTESSRKAFQDDLTGARGSGKSRMNDAKQLQKMIDHKDELSDYIKLMMEYKDLPLDADEDDNRSVIEMGDTGSDEPHHSGSEGEKTQRRKSQRKTRSGRKELTFQDRFACNSAGAKDAEAGNPNARTIEVLQSMADYYDRINDHWRTTAYRKVISTLKRQETKVTTAEEAQRLPSVGIRLAQKIEEIVTTDRLRRLECAQKEPMDEALQLFLGIYGVGTSQAQQWLAQGFRTLDDLKTKAKLSPNQLLGIEHYDDLNTRIPRREVETLGEERKRQAISTLSLRSQTQTHRQS
ncbi:hypothetical protein LCI18_010509 [Fusarium solani-melongenae]|uniref:Uncharacterized protein n=1 Tax=Fusarium solani subsp. cucurbitae TaxID=2747967 RepID=A0ACD3ZE79_FUSSC|nr:hypothetical protein LCI18_010509 [Fusarium solani-melongenae]